jgi:hypothetical protein
LPPMLIKHLCLPLPLSQLLFLTAQPQMPCPPFLRPILHGLLRVHDSSADALARAPSKPRGSTLQTACWDPQESGPCFCWKDLFSVYRLNLLGFVQCVPLSFFSY